MSDTCCYVHHAVKKIHHGITCVIRKGSIICICFFIIDLVEDFYGDFSNFCFNVTTGPHGQGTREPPYMTHYSLYWLEQTRDVSGCPSVIHYLDDFSCISPAQLRICSEGPATVFSVFEIVIDTA